MTLPLRLAAAVFLRPPWEGHASPALAEMTLTAIPTAVQRCFLILANGQLLYPFVDAPHVTSDGIILHGQSPSKSYGLPHPQSVGMHTNPGTRPTCRAGQTSRTRRRASCLSLHSARSVAERPSGVMLTGNIGVYAMQALQDQDVAMGCDAPHARLCREVHSRATDVRSTALTIHDIMQQTMRAGQHATLWQASNACWD